ncbi:MAG TPA: hypothetical protein VIM21_08000 [Gemmatimonadaceae bacterium]
MSPAPPPPPPPVPPQVAVVRGDNQAALAGDVLPIPITVAVTFATGGGLAGDSVTWSIVSGGGQLSSTSSVTDGAGRAAVNWTLGATTGTQSAMATVKYRVAAGADGLVSVSANITATASARPAPQPAILHYDGFSWSVTVQTANKPPLLLNSIWGASPTALFAVGSQCGSMAIMRYDGTSWSPPPDNSPYCGLSELASVWGNSQSDVFVVQRGSVPPSRGSSVYRFDGQATWYPQYNHSCSSVCDPYLNAVWTSSPTSVIAVGDSGFIVRYDGTSWTPEPSRTSQHLRGVWGTGSDANARIFAVGDAGTILSNNGGGWQPQASGTTQALYAVWGTSANDVFAAGAGGTILHYDGTGWAAQSSGTSASLYGMWGSAGNSVFVVGDAHTILYFNGTGWTPQPTSASINLRGVWGTSATDVFAVGRAP